MNKKAQGLPLNAIVIAALVLIVLVVLILIFTGKIGTFVGGVENCAAKGGECKTEAVCKTEGKAPIGKAPDCAGANEVCCISEPK